MYKTICSFIALEDDLIETIETKDIEEITKELNPRALTKFETNTLYMAMKVHDI